MMGLDRLEVARVMGLVREKVEKVKRAKGKGKGPRRGARKADASRPRFVAFSYLQQKVYSITLPIQPSCWTGPL